MTIVQERPLALRRLGPCQKAPSFDEDIIIRDGTDL